MSDYISHYLPVSELAMKWGFYVTGMGQGRIEPGMAYPAHQTHPSLYQFSWNLGRTLPEFQLILITEGRGIFESEKTGTIAVNNDSIILLFPGVWHRYRPNARTGWRERWIGFHGDISHRLMDLGIFSPESPVRKISEPKRFIANFDSLLTHLAARTSHNLIDISFRAISLFVDVPELLKSESHDQEIEERAGDIDDPLVALAMELIWTKSHQILSVNQLARHLPVTRRTLDRRFRAVMGRSVLDEVNRCRISRAKRLLEETVLPLKTIARLAGFTNAERMRVVFREKEKMTPTTFRRNVGR
jgi:AraC-like DNA-binding protein